MSELIINVEDFSREGLGLVVILK